jgi:hypothetical protein
MYRMAKKSKMKTPDWILEGYDSPEEYNKAKGVTGEKKSEKTFKVRECPKCKSDDVGVVLSGSNSEEGGGKEWGCRKCKWEGKDVIEKDLTEEEFMKYLDEKGEEVA